MEGSIHGSGVRVAGEGHEWRHVPVGSLVVGAGALEVEVINFILTSMYIDIHNI